jgi:hypothetical protein
MTAQISPRIAALLRGEKPGAAQGGRLIFALDATASRELTWDMATQLQSRMFEEAAKIGGLSVQLVHYRGIDEVSSSAWFGNARELVNRMRAIRCESGSTKIERVLRHIKSEHERERISAAIFVGDAVEEKPGKLYDAATGCPPLFLFQEGDGVVVDINERGGFAFPPRDTSQPVEAVFRELARKTNGAYARFDAGAATRLGELLTAVAAFATGGLTALGNLKTDSAVKLLSQMK